MKPGYPGIENRKPNPQIEKTPGWVNQVSSLTCSLWIWKYNMNCIIIPQLE